MMNMVFLRTCSVVLLLVLPGTLPPVLAFVSVGVVKRPNPPIASSLSGNHRSFSLSWGASSRRVFQRSSSSSVRLQANLFDWLNGPSSSPTPDKKKQQPQQGDDAIPNNSNPKETLSTKTPSHQEPDATTHPKPSTTPVVTDFFSQWFHTNPPPASSSPPAATPPTREENNMEIQAVTTEPVEPTTTLVNTEDKKEEEKEVVSIMSRLDDEPGPQSSVVLPEKGGIQEMVPIATTLGVSQPVHETTTTMTTTLVHKGRVLWFNARRGYGFIIPDDNDYDGNNDDTDQDPIFVHNSAIDLSHGYFRTLMRGESVEYQSDVDGQGRRVAIHVTGPHGKPVKSILQQQLKGPPKRET